MPPQSGAKGPAPPTPILAEVEITVRLRAPVFPNTDVLSSGFEQVALIDEHVADINKLLVTYTKMQTYLVEAKQQLDRAFLYASDFRHSIICGPQKEESTTERSSAKYRHFVFFMSFPPRMTCHLKSFVASTICF